MIYFVTGITGTVVPLIVEDLMKKDKDPVFYFAIRKDTKGNGIQARFDSVIKGLDLDESTKRKLVENSKLVEIDIEKENLGIDPEIYSELIENTEKILHGAADVRFDQPYEKIRIPNFVFSKKIYALFGEIKQYRTTHGKKEATLYYISTGYAYGKYKKPIPEDFPEFKPGKPDNTYAQTKAEAKVFILDKINRLDDRIVLFEPTIIGGAAKTGKTRTYNLHYVVFMLAYLGKLPFFTVNDVITEDIVPVDWVAAVISDIMAKDEYHQGVMRLASGSEAVPIKFMYEAGYDYYFKHDPIPGHQITKARIVPKWFLLFLIQFQKSLYRTMYFLTRNKRFRKLAKGISLMESYLPYIAGYKVFENTKSNKLIEKYTDCGTAPPMQDIYNEKGELVKKGYYNKIMKDTLETGWGGMVDFERLAQKTTPYKAPQAAYSTSRK